MKNPCQMDFLQLCHLKIHAFGDHYLICCLEHYLNFIFLPSVSGFTKTNRHFGTLTNLEQCLVKVTFSSAPVIEPGPLQRLLSSLL